MKPITRLIVIILMISAVFTSCSNLKEFLKETPSVNKLSDENLRFVQYYTSDPLTLVTKSSIYQGVVTPDNIVSEEHRIYEKNIVIDEETPGVACDIGKGYIKIQVADSMYLTFVPSDTTSKSPYVFNAFNDSVVTDNSPIEFHGIQYLLRYGKAVDKSPGTLTKHNPRITVIPGNRPILLYEYVTVKEEKKEIEIIEGKFVK